jgi:hypothetical protein
MVRAGPSAATPAHLAAPGRLAAPVRVAAGLAGLALAAGALAIAEGPGRATTYAGSSAAGAALTVCAGLGLIAAGLVIRLARQPGRTGDLALGAGVCWFAPVWVAWQDGPPLIPSIAMVAAGFTFPLIVHLVLTHSTGWAGSRPARLLAAVVYGEALLTAAALALFRDPYFDPGCLANCTVNSFLVRPLPSLARTVEVADRWFTAAAATTLIALCAARLARASAPARQRLLPVHVPAVGFAAVVVARAAVLQKTTVEDPFNPALFTIFAIGSAAVILLAAGLISGVGRARAERRTVARIAASLDQAPAPGSLQFALAAALHDPGLQIAYWLPGAQSYVDASGRAVPEPSATPGRAVTRLTRTGRTVAVISIRGRSPGSRARSGRPSGWAWRTSGCKPNCSPSLKNSAPPVPGSWRPPTPNAAGWSGTCTTAPNSACWRCPTTSGSRGPPRRRTKTPRPTGPSRRRPGKRWASWGNCGISPTASIRRCWPKRG